MRRLPRWAPWALMVALVAGALAIGGSGDAGPPTDAERARSVAASVRCPTCRGQSALESDASTAEAIRDDIARRIADGQSDDEIRAALVAAYGESILLTPPRSGVAGLIWVLPVAAMVVAAAGIAFAFRRWRAAPGESDWSPHEGERPAVATRSEVAARRPGRGRRIVAASLVAALAVGAGVGVAASSGERRPGETATGSIRQTTTDRLAEARRHMRQGEALEAVKLYDAVLAEEPRNREALAYKGWLLVLAGLVDQGVALLDQAVEVDGDYVDARFFRAVTRHRQLDDPEGALADIRAVLANDPPPDVTPAAVELLRELEAATGSPSPEPTAPPE